MTTKQKKHNVSTKTQWMVATSSVLLLTALAIFIWWADTNSGWMFVKKPVSFSSITVKGELGCLPHRDSDGPKTLECAQGIKTASGDYYAVSGVIDGRNKDGHVEVTGELQPTQRGSKYQSAGTIVVE